jgi:hypothetical protein
MTTTSPSVPLPDPTKVEALRTWLADHRADLNAVRAWADQLLTALAPVPALGRAEWLALDERDPRKLAAAIRPALAYLVESTPEAIAARLRAELDEFATAWRRAHKEASADVSRARTDLGYGIGPSHAELVRRRQLTSTVSCGTCDTAVTLLHPLPDEYAARLPDLSWVRCTDCPQTTQLSTVRRKDAA